MTEIEFSPHDSSVILAGGDVLSMVRSVDGGATWRHVEGLLSAEISRVTWHPADPDEVWVGTLSGPHVSRDGGSTWEPSRAGLPELSSSEFTAPVEVVVFDPSDESRLLAFGGNRRESVLTGDVGLPGNPAWGTVWESRNGGANWSAIGSLPGIVTDAVHLDVDTMLASVDEAGLFRSVDGGATWSAVGSGLDNPNIRDIEVLPDGTVWVAVEGAVMGEQVVAGAIASSVDGGTTFTEVDTGVEPSVGASIFESTGYRSIVAAPGDPSVLYTSNVAWQQETVLRSGDGGATWATLVDGATAGLGPRFYGSPPIANDISVAVDSPDHVALAASEYVLVSDDGQTWVDATSVEVGDGESRGTGFSGLVTNSVFIGAEDPGLMILMAFDGGNLLVSRDGGAGWTNPLFDEQPFGGGQETAEGPGGQLVTLLGQAGVFAGIAVSGDGGVGWEFLAGAERRTARRPDATAPRRRDPRRLGVPGLVGELAVPQCRRWSNLDVQRDRRGVRVAGAGRRRDDLRCCRFRALRERRRGHHLLPGRRRPGRPVEAHHRSVRPRSGVRDQLALVAR